MAGRYVSEIEIKTNVEEALKQILELQKKTDDLENKEYKIDIGVDSQKLEKVIGSLEKMLDSLGKGTGDFKQFENLSKELSDVISEVQSLSKAFGKVDDSGTKTLLSSIQSIDKSLSDLSKHITGVNADFGSIGKNASDNVGQINEAKKATEGLTNATNQQIDAVKKATEGLTNATNQQIDDVEKTTSAYKNQAYELASVLKMLEKIDKFYEVSYAGSMSKAVKANAKSYKKDDIIQFSFKDYNISEEALRQLRGLSVNLEKAFNYSDTLGLDTATIENVEVLIQYFRELLKEILKFNNTKLNTADTEELIKALGIAKKEVFDDGTGKKINSYDGYLNKYSSVSEIISFLKQQEQQILATAEAEQKLANVEQQSSNSSLAENQDKIQQELKETEKVAEQTAEALEKINSNGDKSNISSGDSSTNPADAKTEIKANSEVSNSIQKKKQELASYELQLEETRYEVEKLLKVEKESYGFSGEYTEKQVTNLRDRLTDRVFGTSGINNGYSGTKKWMIFGKLSDPDASYLKSYQMYEQELRKVGYTLSEIRETSLGLEADILPIDGKAITNAEEFRKALDSIVSTSPENIELLNKQIFELESKISSLKSEIESLEHSANSPIKDVFQNEKVEQATTSAKELDKTLEQVNIPTDSFDDVLSKLDLAKSELKDIVKITKQSVSDADGKFHDSYTLKDSRGSTEIYGLSSNTEKGQLLRSNIVQYDVKDEEQEKKALLEVEKQITEETKKQNAEQQKKWDNFQKENAEENKKAYQELTDTIQQYSEVSKRIANGKALDGDIELAQKLEDKISTLQKQPILSSSQIDESERKLEKLLNQLDAIEKKQVNKAAEQEAKTVEKNNKAYEKQIEKAKKLSEVNKNRQVKEQQSSVNSALKQQESAWKNIQSIREKIAKADSKDEDYISLLKETKIEYQKQYIEAGKVLKANQDIYDSEKQVNKLKQIQLETDAKISKYKASQKTSTVSSFQSSIDSYQSKYNQYNNRPAKKQSVEYQNLLKEYENQLDQLKKRFGELSEEEIISEDQIGSFNKLKEQLDATDLKFQNVFKGDDLISVKKEIDTITQYMSKNTRISSEAKDKLRGYIDELKTKGADANVKAIHDAFLDVCIAERKAKREGQSFLDVLRDKVWYQWAAQIGSYFSLNDILNYGKQAVETIIELDTALVDLKKTTAMSSSQMEDFYFDANDVAKEMGATTKEIIEQASAWSRLGLTT